MTAAEPGQPGEGGSTEGPAGRIAWRRIGDGPNLLMLNGYAASSFDWDPVFLEELAGRFTLICPDNRGIGESGGPPETISIESMSEDAEALLDRLAIDSCDLLGWSMGGFVAQQLAANRPERVRKLVLLSTDPGGDLAVRRSGEVDARLTDHGGTPREQARRLLDLLFPPDVAPQLFERFGDIVAEARSGLRPEILTAQERAMDEWYQCDSSIRLDSIEAPTLIARGELDEVIPPENSVLLAGAIVRSRIEMFKGGGHAFMAQFPVAAGRLVRDFASG